MNAHHLLNVFLQFVHSEPLAYAYLICVAAGAGSIIAACLHLSRAKRLRLMLLGPVPTLAETDKLRQFQESRRELVDKTSDASFGYGACAVICLIIVVLLFKVSDDYMLILFSAMGALALGGIIRIASAQVEDNCKALMQDRPELACLGYLDKLPAKPAEAVEDKLFWANLDDYICVFHIRQGNAPLPPLEPAEAKALSEAQWQAINVDRPQAGELALILWRGEGSTKVKVVVTKIKSVEEAPAELQASRPGKSLITVAGQKFCGGKMAHYCDTPNEKIERGWMATADTAHVMLASLRWLDANQREYCWQLINPGKAYPGKPTS